MNKLLVTGGAGFIGSNYNHYLFEKYGDDVNVVNLDKLTYAGNLENLKSVESKSNYTFVKGDICDTELMTDLFAKEEIDTVVHFAAESHVDRSIHGPDDFINTNIIEQIRTEIISKTNISNSKVRGISYKSAGLGLNQLNITIFQTWNIGFITRLFPCL